MCKKTNNNTGFFENALRTAKGSWKEGVSKGLHLSG